MGKFIGGIVRCCLRTEILLLENAQHTTFSDYTLYKSSFDKVGQNSIRGESEINCQSYGAKEIRFYNADNSLIASMNNNNSGFCCFAELSEGIECYSLAGFVTMPIQDIIKMSISYKLYSYIYALVYNNTNNLETSDTLYASVSFTRYAATKMIRGYSHNNLLPGHIEWAGASLHTQTNSKLRLIYPDTLSKKSFSCSPIEINYCCIRPGTHKELVDYTEQQYENIVPNVNNSMVGAIYDSLGKILREQLLYSTQSYQDLSSYELPSFYEFLTNYDNLLKIYNDSGTLDNIHFFNGLWIVKITTTRKDKNNGEILTKNEYKSFYQKDKAIEYAESNYIYILMIIMSKLPNMN